MSNYQPHLIVDSGAYSAFTLKKGPIDLQEYIAFVHKMLRRKPDAEYVNLDVIGAGTQDTGELSYNNWMEMRKNGLTPLPVYHVNADIKWLKKYLAQTDYVALGAIADMVTHRRMLALDRVFEDYLIEKRTRLPKFRTHAMGVTSFPLIQRYPWFSLDSTSWLQAASYGKIFVPRLKGGQWDYARAPYQMNMSFLSPSLKDRKVHIQNLTPHMRAVLDKYIADMGFVLGKSKFVDKVEEVVEPGLANSYYHRRYANALFFARFVGAMAYPRPFSAFRPLSLHDQLEEELQGGKVPETTTCTRMFFSGHSTIENFMRQRAAEFHNCGIMLTYYTLRQSNTTQIAQRYRGLLKGKPYREDELIVKGTKVTA